VLRNFEGKQYCYPQADQTYVRDTRDVELINF